MTFAIISATLFSEEGSRASELDTAHPSSDHEADKESSDVSFLRIKTSRYRVGSTVLDKHDETGKQ